MSAHHIEIDRTRPLADQPGRGHNRWHPAIPPVLSIDSGDRVVIECLDALDNQITPASTVADLYGLRLGRAHPLTGPIQVRGAEPGMVLEIAIEAVDPGPFGYTFFVPGFGMLADDFPTPFLAMWELQANQAVSDDIPGVSISAAPFMGTLGVAPSPDTFRSVAAAEKASHDLGGAVMLPDPQDAVPADEPASTGLRTIPPRSTGGNVDIRQLHAGSTAWLPVDVGGALFSIGDGHFAQGDGESCGTAIEMAATVTATLTLREETDTPIRSIRYAGSSPDGDRWGSGYVATTGLPEHHGRISSEDLGLAARNAVRAMIDHLAAEWGYTREQAYAICSVAVDLRISQAVDVPSPLVSALLPLSIFE